MKFRTAFVGLILVILVTAFLVPAAPSVSVQGTHQTIDRDVGVPAFQSSALTVLESYTYTYTYTDVDIGVQYKEQTLLDQNRSQENISATVRAQDNENILVPRQSQKHTYINHDYTGYNSRFGQGGPQVSTLYDTGLCW